MIAEAATLDAARPDLSLKSDEELEDLLRQARELVAESTAVMLEIRAEQYSRRPES